jgi:hypothetical protein
MSDKYDEAIAFLTANPHKISECWMAPDNLLAGELFQFVTPSGLYDSNDYMTEQCRKPGCLSQIRADRGLAWTPELTKEVKKDERIPADEYQIGVEHLPVFAEWQRRLDKEIRGVTETISVHQDGREFYNSVTGEMIYQWTSPVKDFDLETAQEARRYFINWCKEKHLNPDFTGP